MTGERKIFDHMPWKEYQEQFFLEEDKSTEDILNDSFGKKKIELIKKWVGKGKKVLDIGGCWGIISNEIREYGNDVMLLDMPRVIKKAKERHPELKFLAGSALDIPTEEKFDVVVATEIIEHILDLERFFAEIKRVLKDDGKLIITTPNVSRLFNIVCMIKGGTTGWEYYGEPILHCRHFTPSILAKTVIDNGFDILEAEGVETNVGMDWTGFTKEEAEFLIKLIEKFQPHPFFRSGGTCVLCKKKK